MGVGLIIHVICRFGCNDGSCKFCSQNLCRGECLGCLNGSYGPGYSAYPYRDGKMLSPGLKMNTHNTAAFDSRVAPGFGGLICP